jgi:parallel beta-helix repeat protein
LVIETSFSADNGAEQGDAVVGERVAWSIEADAIAGEARIALPQEAQGIAIMLPQGSQNVEVSGADADVIGSEEAPIVIAERAGLRMEISLDLPQGAPDGQKIEVTYQTPAPEIRETALSGNSKEITISSETHYENILARAALPYEAATKEGISLLHISDEEMPIFEPVAFEAFDTDANGLLDTVEWMVPSLSNQTYVLSLNILTIYSHPTLGGNWTVDFATTGTAALNITASLDPSYYPSPTRWSNESEDAGLFDLRFMELSCNGATIPTQWMGENCEQSECSVLAENYTCEGTGALTSKVLTAKPHVLLFGFGGQQQFAYNDVNNVSACANLSVAGENYTLNQSVSVSGATCFNITAANITLNCNGFSMTGNNATGTFGIYSNQWNTTIKNCNISNFATDIYFGNASSGTIQSVNASTTRASSGLDGYAIFLNNGSNFNNITSVNATSSIGYGIYLNSSSSNFLYNASGAVSSGYAIYLYSGSDYNVLDFVTAITQSGQGLAIQFDSRFNNVSNARATSTNGYAIYLASPNNSITASNANSTGTGRGFFLEGGHNNSISNSTAASDSGRAVYLDSSRSNTFSNLTALTVSGYGFYLSSSHNNTFIGSNATGTGSGSTGMFLSASSNNNLSGMNVTGSSTGIQMQTNSNSNEFSYLSVKSLASNAFSMASSSYNILHDLNSSSSSSSGSGIVLTSANYNVFYALNVTETGSSGSSGIYVSGSSHNVFYNISASVSSSNAGSAAIYLLSGANNNTFANLTATANGGRGLALSYGANNTFSNVSATSASGMDFYFSATGAGSCNNTLVEVNGTGGLPVLYQWGSPAPASFSNTVAAAVVLCDSNGSTVANTTALKGGFQVYYSSLNNLSNLTASGSGYSPFTLGYSSNNSLSLINTSISSGNGHALTLSNAYDNVVAESNATGVGDSGIFIGTSANNRFIRCGGFSSTDYGLYLDTSSSNTFTECLFRANGGSFGTVLIYSGSHNNTVANSTINGMRGTRAIYLSTTANTGNRLINNTVMNSTVLLAVGTAASHGGNYFYLNNFTNIGNNSTNAPLHFVQDLNGSNFYNATVDGKNQGNLYGNVENGSVAVSGANASSLPGLYIGFAGAGVPYNNSTSQGKFNCSFSGCGDAAPLTPSYDTCGTLSEAGGTTTLEASISRSGSTCFTVAAANVTIDCNGFSIRGSNTSSTYGITSTQPNTTIRNCNISNFQHGIYFNGASNGSITNTNSSTTQSSGYGILLSSSSSNTLSGINASAKAAQAIRLASSSSYNTLANISATANTYVMYIITSCNFNQLINITLAGGTYGAGLSASSYNTLSGINATASNGIALGFESGSNHNTVLHSRLNSASLAGVDISASSNNTVLNSTILGRGNAATNGGLTISGTSQNNTVANSTINGLGGSSGNAVVNIFGAGNTLSNNTILNGTTMVHLNASAYNNLLYWNNFTSLPWVNSSNASNHFNTTVDGRAQGNHYYNISAYNLSDSNVDGWADFGSAYPLNSTNAPGAWIGSGADYGPWVGVSRTITYPAKAYWNGTLATYFANGSTANISAPFAFASAPKLTIADSAGAVQVANATMLGADGAYYYEYAINGTLGWYNATVMNASNDLAYTTPQLFYGAPLWQNFTDYSGQNFSGRTPMNVSEPSATVRDWQPMDAAITFPFGVNDTSLRLVLSQGGQLLEIPSQFHSLNYSGSAGKAVSGRVAFVDSFALSQNKTYYAYYDFANRTPSAYGGDYSANATRFSSLQYSASVSPLLGGTLSALQAAYLSRSIAGKTGPMESPEVDISGLLASAQNQSAPNSSFTNGSLFATHSFAGSVNASGLPIFSYNITYTSYSRAPYFIVETNASSPATFFSWSSYYDSLVYIAEEHFTNLSYQNASGIYNVSSLSANITGMGNISWLALSSPFSKMGFGIAHLNASSGYAPQSTFLDSAADRYYQAARRAYSGSVTNSSSFHSRSAYAVFDSTDNGTMQQVYLALANPMQITLGNYSHADTPAPSFTQANYTPYPAPNDTGNVTCFSYWESGIDLSSATLTFNSSGYSAVENYTFNASAGWANFTVNSSVLQAGNASCAITVYDAFSQQNSTTINFTAADRKPPVPAISYAPNTTAGLDPNVTIAFFVNFTEYTGMGAALLQHSTDNATFENTTMSLASSGSHWHYYEANLTPAAEANYTVRIYANDTAGNGNTSANTYLQVAYEWTWELTPSTFSVAALYGENATLANVTINNTGDRALAFNLSSNYYDRTRIYWNGVPEDSALPAAFLAPGENATFVVVATAKATAGEDNVTITAYSLNASASPASNASSGTFISYSGGPYLSLEFITVPSTVARGNASVALAGRAKNIGNETATAAVLEWLLPAAWSITAGSGNSSATDIAAGGSLSSNITVSLSASAALGTQYLNISANCSEGRGGSASTSSYVTCQAGTTLCADGTCQASCGSSPSPSPGGGGGGGGGGGSSNATRPANVTQKKVAKNLTREEKQDVFATLASYELVRGKDTAFGFNVTNPLDARLENITVNVSGYLYQYISIEPDYIESIGPRGSREVQVGISAPTYFTEGAFTLYFVIAGTSVEETEESIITTRLEEKRTVELKVLEMDRESAFRLLSQAYAIRKDMSERGTFQGAAVEQFLRANSSYAADRFGQLKDAVSLLYGIYNADIEAGKRLADLRRKLDDAQASNIKTAQTDRLYRLATLAFERGDYANAIKLSEDADLTYQLETVQGFSLEAFASKYWVHLLGALFALALLCGAVFMGLRYWMIGNELSQLSNEEGIVLGLMRETQREYFGEGRMSSEEYTLSLQQYNERLGKIIQRKVELETYKKNYLNFSGRKRRLLVEKERIEELMRELQKDYLGRGKIDTSIYDNRMKVYVARLSELEEAIAIDETHEGMGKGLPRPDSPDARKEGAGAQQKKQPDAKKKPS